ncbi:DNA polymerase III subunit delta' [Palleronia sp. KMU-117]|uniref:DNA polymerase III subunit delta' n=1 Tax=Palleronia sp. KMU-117 TaxID=3434108 RepID=UPI003D74C8DA
MSGGDGLPEPDRVGEAPHPRETLHLFGQEAAEAEVLAAHTAGRMHHAWLLTGPRGVGKATLAWRIARFLLTQPPRDDGPGLFGDAPPAPAPATLDTDPGHPVVRRMQALAEPRLFLLRRGPNDKGDRLMATIGVDEARKLGSFLALTAADGGTRVVIVDAADELNPNAANAILKLLEEPPRGVVFLLVSHQPARLLPTIRSRCRKLALPRLPAADLALALTRAGYEPGPDPVDLAELSDGSAGMAVRLLEGEGLQLYRDLVGTVATMPGMDREAAVKLADHIGARGQGERQELAVYLVGLLLGRLARCGAGHPPMAEAAPDEAALLRRLSPDAAAGRHWAALQSNLTARLGQGLAVNLDPATLILDTMIRINEAAGPLSVRA